MKSKDMDKHEKAWHNPYIQLLHNKIKHHNNAGMFRMMRSPGQERFLSGVELVLFCPEYKYMDDLWRSITKLPESHVYVRGFFFLLNSENCNWSPVWCIAPLPLRKFPSIHWTGRRWSRNVGSIAIYGQNAVADFKRWFPTVSGGRFKLAKFLGNASFT